MSLYMSHSDFNHCSYDHCYPQPHPFLLPRYLFLNLSYFVIPSAMLVVAVGCPHQQMPTLLKGDVPDARRRSLASRSRVPGGGAGTRPMAPRAYLFTFLTEEPVTFSPIQLFSSFGD